LVRIDGRKQHDQRGLMRGNKENENMVINKVGKDDQKKRVRKRPEKSVKKEMTKGVEA
jgi:hypothetical protein